MNQHNFHTDPGFIRLMQMWREWHPFAPIHGAHDDYESLTILTLETLKGLPDRDELMNSLHYFITLESNARIKPAPVDLKSFTQRILEDQVLKRYSRQRWRQP